MTYNGILVSHKKEWNNAICSNLDGPRGYHTKWSKPEKDKQISFDSFFIDYFNGSPSSLPTSGLVLSLLHPDLRVNFQSCHVSLDCSHSLRLWEAVAHITSIPSVWFHYPVKTNRGVPRGAHAGFIYTSASMQCLNSDYIFSLTNSLNFPLNLYISSL